MDKVQLYAVYPNTVRPASTHLSGDCSGLQELTESTGKALERIAAEMFKSMAIQAGHWAEVSLMGLAISSGNPGTANGPGVAPAAWYLLNDTHPLVRSFNRMCGLDLVTIKDGYACPTQKLVDLILEA